MALPRSDISASVAPAWVLYEQGDLAGAERHCRKQLKKAAADIAALQLLALVLLDTGRAQEGQALIERAVRIDGRLARSHMILGLVLDSLQDYESALRSFRRAQTLEPDNAEHWFNVANALSDLARKEDAVAAFNQAIALRADFAEAHRNRGVVLHQLQRYDESLLSLDAALLLNPRMFTGVFTRAKTQLALERLSDALRDLDAAVTLGPSEADAHNVRGIVLQKLGRFDDALESFRLATLLQPEHAGAHWNEGLCRLAMGDWSRESWAKYEWGWQTQRYPLRSFSQSLWLGEPSIADKTILLHDEQGLGDTIQFARFATQVAALGAKVILQVQAPLKRLMGSLAGPQCVLADGEPLPSFDHHCPLLSLPLALGVTEETLPRPQRYLTADDGSIACWRGRIGPSDKLRVGIAWAGSVVHKDDRNRSLPLNELLKLQDEGVELVSLQRELRDGDMALLDAHGVRHFGDELQDFSDTASLIMQMDLVVSVSTAVAHLAAALGKPTWILLSHSPDWRWMHGRRDTPWHPTATLFRQTRPGNWTSVIEEACRALGCILHARVRD